MAGSQPADRGNKLAGINSIAGISLPLQFKQISSGMPIFRYQPIAESLLALQI
jgi:hypothetical protein